MLNHAQLSFLAVLLWVGITYLATAKKEFPWHLVILAVIITLELLSR